MQLFDTHCHIYEPGYKLPIAEVEERARKAGVDYLLCVGVDVTTSRQAVAFVRDRPNYWASVGLHPHDAQLGNEALAGLRALLTVEPILSSVEQPLGSGAEGDGHLPGQQGLAGGGNPAVSGSQQSGQAPQAEVQRTSPVERYLDGGVADGARGTDKKTITASAFPASVESLVTEASFPGGDRPETARYRGAPSSVPLSTKSRESFHSHGSKIVAIGECGLDYFYKNSPKKDQEKALRFQIELALEYDLPLIFHVREAFDDFWPIFDSYKNIRGVLHSFTDTQENMQQALSRGLHIGLNGIMTFTKNQWQLDVAKAVPLTHLLLETDAPFLTPRPFRGTVNEPAHVRVVAEFLANLRGESLDQLAAATTRNAHHLFKTNILKTP